MELIDKDFIVTEIEKRQMILDLDSSLGWGGMVELQLLKDKIDILEVKEVDLEKEIDNQVRLLGGVHTMENDTNWYKGPYSELVFFAKHFFELGLRIQKGE